VLIRCSHRLPPHRCQIILSADVRENFYRTHPIRTRALRRYEARKGVPLANATVDNERIRLRAVVNWADEVEEVAVPSIRWGKLGEILLCAQKQRLLTFSEQGKLFAVLQEDLRDVVEV
jgi:hypothetical protein